MAKDTQVLVRVEQSRKDEWQDAANERGLSLTGLVRMAMNNELDDRQRPSTGTETESTSTEQVDELQATVDGMDERMRSVESTLNTVADALVDMRAEVEEEASEVSQRQVLEYIPEKADLKRPDQGGGTTIDYDGAADARTIAIEISQDIDNPPVDAVRATLQQLSLQSERLIAVGVDDDQKTRYYIDA